MDYIIYDKKGKILRVTTCSPAMSKIQAKEDEFMMEGTADDATQKVANGKIVDKTPEEIEADNPVIPELDVEDQPILITRGQWRSIMNRIEELER